VPRSTPTGVRGEDLFEPIVDDLGEQIALVLELPVQRSFNDARLFGDFRHESILVAPRRDDARAADMMSATRRS